MVFLEHNYISLRILNCHRAAKHIGILSMSGQPDPSCKTEVANVGMVKIKVDRWSVLKSFKEFLCKDTL